MGIFCISGLEWTVGALSTLVAALIGWQILMTLSIQRLIRRQIDAVLKKETPRIKGEIMGIAFYNIGDHSERNGDISHALTSYIKAIDNMKAAKNFEAEVQLCLDKIEGILKKIGPNKKALAFPYEAGVEYFNMLYTLKDARAQKLASLFFEYLLISPKEEYNL